MAALRHPNVVAFLGVCATPPCVATGEPSVRAAVAWETWVLLLLLSTLSLRIAHNCSILWTGCPQPNNPCLALMPPLQSTARAAR